MGWRRDWRVFLPACPHPCPTPRTPLPLPNTPTCCRGTAEQIRHFHRRRHRRRTFGIDTIPALPNPPGRVKAAFKRPEKPWCQPAHLIPQLGNQDFSQVGFQLRHVASHMNPHAPLTMAPLTMALLTTALLTMARPVGRQILLWCARSSTGKRRHHSKRYRPKERQWLLAAIGQMGRKVGRRGEDDGDEEDEEDRVAGR